MKFSNTVIGGMIAAFATLAAGAAVANEQPLYDRKIEEAVIRILQPKLGDLRGSLGLKPGGHIHPPINQRSDDGGRSAWMELTEKPKMARISWN